MTDLETQLTAEAETLHALLADASATLLVYAAYDVEGIAARACLRRISDGTPLDPFANG